MVTDPSAERIDKAIGDEPPDYLRLMRRCRNCDGTYEQHRALNAFGMLYQVCDADVLAEVLADGNGNTFEELTDDDIASMKADEEYSRRKDEGLL